MSPQIIVRPTFLTTRDIDQSEEDELKEEEEYVREMGEEQGEGMGEEMVMTYVPLVMSGRTTLCIRDEISNCTLPSATPCPMRGITNIQASWIFHLQFGMGIEMETGMFICC